MKNFFLILLIIFLLGSGYFLFNTNQKNIELQKQVSSLKLESSGLTLQISELQNRQLITGATEEVLPEITTTNTGNMSPTNTETITNKANPRVNYLNNPRDCNRLDGGEGVYGTPNNNYFKAVKLINSKLQEIWDKGQSIIPEYINEANKNLSNSSLNNNEKCMYSWLIDELQNQKGYLKSYKTQNGIVTIGIDFVTYIDNEGQIDYGLVSGPLFQIKNTSTKVREYVLTSSPQLQTLYVDNRGFTTNNQKKLYINNFTDRLNKFCNNQKIYTPSEGININRNEDNDYCTKNRIKKLGKELFQPINFNFNTAGEIQKIDLNRRYLSTAG